MLRSCVFRPPMLRYTQHYTVLWLTLKKHFWQWQRRRTALTRKHLRITFSVRSLRTRTKSTAARRTTWRRCAGHHRGYGEDAEYAPGDCRDKVILANGPASMTRQALFSSLSAVFLLAFSLAKCAKMSLSDRN